MRNVHLGNDVRFMLKVLKYSLDKNTLFSWTSWPCNIFCTVAVLPNLDISGGIFSLISQNLWSHLQECKVAQLDSQFWIGTYTCTYFQFFESFIICPFFGNITLAKIGRFHGCCNFQKINNLAMKYVKFGNTDKLELGNRSMPISQVFSIWPSFKVSLEKNRNLGKSFVDKDFHGGLQVGKIPLWNLY